MSLIVLAAINSNVNFNNPSNNLINLTLANITAMASDGEGPITDPNIALHRHLTNREDKNGKIIAQCCVLRYYEDECNYRLEWGDCRGNW